jgi:hypothetical protein
MVEAGSRLMSAGRMAYELVGLAIASGGREILRIGWACDLRKLGR